MGTQRRKFKLWSGNDARSGKIEILVKEKIYGNVVEVRRKRDRVMAILQIFGRGMI